MSFRRLSHAAHYYAAAFVALFVANKSGDVERVTLGGLVYRDGGSPDESGERRRSRDADAPPPTEEELLLAALGALYAAEAAESRFDPGLAPEHRAKDDAENERRWLDALAALNPSCRSPYEHWLRARARSVVDANWPFICALALEIEKRGGIACADAELFVEEAKGLEPARSALRLRRARAVTLPAA